MDTEQKFLHDISTKISTIYSCVFSLKEIEEENTKSESYKLVKVAVAETEGLVEMIKSRREQIKNKPIK